MRHSRLTVRQVRGVAVAELRDERIDRLDPQAVDEISQSLLSLVPKGNAVKLLVDFSRVNFMGSTLLGVLIRLSKRTAENGGFLKLCGLTPAIANMFSLIKLDQIFDIYQDQQSAMDSYDATV